MGFDTESILNVETVPGEYYCAFCRLLVYPSEAQQTQCGHLFCRACLLYVLSTTRYCPYDNHPVTETDLKGLHEVNAPLYGLLCRIPVRCLYHKSGCLWQGPLVQSPAHSANCQYGSFPVICNRCGLQVLHRQVQEHAQTCAGSAEQQEQGATLASQSQFPIVDNTQVNQAGLAQYGSLQGQPGGSAAEVQQVPGAQALQYANGQPVAPNTQLQQVPVAQAPPYASGQEQLQVQAEPQQPQPQADVQAAAQQQNMQLPPEEWYYQQQYHQYYQQQYEQYQQYQQYEQQAQQYQQQQQHQQAPQYQQAQQYQQQQQLQHQQAPQLQLQQPQPQAQQQYQQQQQHQQVPQLQLQQPQPQALQQYQQQQEQQLHQQQYYHDGQQFLQQEGPALQMQQGFIPGQQPYQSQDTIQQLTNMQPQMHSQQLQPQQSLSHFPHQQVQKQQQPQLPFQQPQNMVQPQAQHQPFMQFQPQPQAQTHAQAQPQSQPQLQPQAHTHAQAQHQPQPQPQFQQPQPLTQVQLQAQQVPMQNQQQSVAAAHHEKQQPLQQSPPAWHQQQHQHMLWLQDGRPPIGNTGQSQAVLDPNVYPQQAFPPLMQHSPVGMRQTPASIQQSPTGMQLNVPPWQGQTPSGQVFMPQQVVHSTLQLQGAPGQIPVPPQAVHAILQHQGGSGQIPPGQAAPQVEVHTAPHHQGTPGQTPPGQMPVPRGVHTTLQRQGTSGQMPPNQTSTPQGAHATMQQGASGQMPPRQTSMLQQRPEVTVQQKASEQMPSLQASVQQQGVHATLQQQGASREPGQGTHVILRQETHGQMPSGQRSMQQQGAQAILHQQGPLLQQHVRSGNQQAAHAVSNQKVLSQQDQKALTLQSFSGPSLNHAHSLTAKQSVQSIQPTQMTKGVSQDNSPLSEKASTTPVPISQKPLSEQQFSSHPLADVKKEQDLITSQSGSVKDMKPTVKPSVIVSTESIPAPNKVPPEGEEKSSDDSRIQDQQKSQSPHEPMVVEKIAVVANAQSEKKQPQQEGAKNDIQNDRMLEQNASLIAKQAGDSQAQEVLDRHVAAELQSTALPKIQEAHMPANSLLDVPQKAEDAAVSTKLESNGPPKMQAPPQAENVLNPISPARLENKHHNDASRPFESEALPVMPQTMHPRPSVYQVQHQNFQGQTQKQVLPHLAQSAQPPTKPAEAFENIAAEPRRTQSSFRNPPLLNGISQKSLIETSRSDVFSASPNMDNRQVQDKKMSQENHSGFRSAAQLDDFFSGKAGGIFPKGVAQNIESRIVADREQLLAKPKHPEVSSQRTSVPDLAKYPPSIPAKSFDMSQRVSLPLPMPAFHSEMGVKSGGPAEFGKISIVSSEIGLRQGLSPVLPVHSPTEKDTGGLPKYPINIREHFTFPPEGSTPKPYEEAGVRPFLIEGGTQFSSLSEVRPRPGFPLDQVLGSRPVSMAGVACSGPPMDIKHHSGFVPGVDTHLRFPPDSQTHFPSVVEARPGFSLGTHGHHVPAENKPLIGVHVDIDSRPGFTINPGRQSGVPADIGAFNRFPDPIPDSLGQRPDGFGKMPGKAPEYIGPRSELFRSEPVVELKSHLTGGDSGLVFSQREHSGWPSNLKELHSGPNVFPGPNIGRDHPKFGDSSMKPFSLHPNTTQQDSGQLLQTGSVPNTTSLPGVGIGQLSGRPTMEQPLPGFPPVLTSHGPQPRIYSGDFRFQAMEDPVDLGKKRKQPGSLGYCRICHIDYYTVEGLQRHCQTEEHRKRTLDLVVSIKQDNAMKQKM